MFDGTGVPGRVVDLAMSGDRIVAVGNIDAIPGMTEIEARGMAVAPGFINTLSWATESLIQDGRSQSDIRQGVTLEVFGEGNSMGPLTEVMRADLLERQRDFRYAVPWTTLRQYLDHLAQRGVSPNVASFIGATTVRVSVIGHDDRRPNHAELDVMRGLVDDAMRGGALGVASSLIYAPASFSDTEELVALAEVAAAHGGMYASHMRSEGDHIADGASELIEIARRARLPAEIYHFKVAGRANWPKLDSIVGSIEAARASGLLITADMYPYDAGSTGLQSTMGPWVQEGGHRAWVDRLHLQEVRQRVIYEMSRPGRGWENVYYLAGSPENVRIVAFKSPALKPLTGKTLAEIAALRGTTPEETAIDLVVEDDSRVTAVYTMMDPTQVRRIAALPWASFCSDQQSVAPEGSFLSSAVHPRAYGAFARVVGPFVRDDRVAPLEEIIRRLTSFPAGNLGIANRGRLAPGYCGRRRFRPGAHPGPCNVRPAPSIRHGHAPRLRERSARIAQRRAHRRDSGSRRAAGTWGLT